MIWGWLCEVGLGFDGEMWGLGFGFRGFRVVEGRFELRVWLKL